MASARPAASIYRKTAVTRIDGCIADVVTLEMRCTSADGESERVTYHTLLWDAGLQVAFSQKDANYYHGRMCQIAANETQRVPDRKIAHTRSRCSK